MLSVFEAADKRPSATALVYEGQCLSFTELSTRVEGISKRLACMGLLDAAATPVALVVRPSLPSLEVLYALFAYGVPVLLIHPRLPAADRERLVERAAARRLLAPDEIPLSASSAKAPPLPAALDPLAPLVIVPTSGTTGTPKLTLLSRAACVASARASIESLELRSSDRWLLCLPVAHVGGLSILLRSLLAGSAAVLFDAGLGLLSRLPELSRRLVGDRVSVASLVPTTLDGLLRLSPRWQPGPELRAVLVGGAPLGVGLYQRATARGVPVRTTYGLTESCSQLTVSSPEDPPRVVDRDLSSGRALPGVELSIREDGRLRVRGPTLFSGYLGDAPRDPASWFVTEDLARLEPDGQLFVLGRRSELIITGGENVDPRRVEAALERDPNVELAVVFGVPDERFGQVVACALVAKPGLDLGQLGQRLALDLARHELPRRVAQGARLLLPNGKIDRAGMREAAVPNLQVWSS